MPQIKQSLLLSRPFLSKTGVAKLSEASVPKLSGLSARECLVMTHLPLKKIAGKFLSRSFPHRKRTCHKSRKAVVSLRLVFYWENPDQMFPRRWAWGDLVCCPVLFLTG